MFNDRVSEYSQVQESRSLVEKVKRVYIKYLISLGYIFEQQGMYESTTYWAIHRDYYVIPDKRGWDDDFDGFDGTVTPDYFPVGAFIKINSIAESEMDDPWETDYFLYENKCSIEYLSQC